MKKFTELSLAILGIGGALLASYQLKRHYSDQTEDRILKQMQDRYQGDPIKGTWIQRFDDYYICEITVMIDHQWQHHQFRTDRSGRLIFNY